MGEFACAWLAATGAVLELDESLDVDADDDEVELDDLEGALAFDDAVSYTHLTLPTT